MPARVRQGSHAGFFVWTHFFHSFFILWRQAAATLLTIRSFPSVHFAQSP